MKLGPNGARLVAQMAATIYASAIGQGALVSVEKPKAEAVRAAMEIMELVAQHTAPELRASFIIDEAEPPPSV